MEEKREKTLEEIRTEEVWEAAQTGNFKELRRLIENTAANLRVWDENHNSALHYGVLSGNVSVVQYLVERAGLKPLLANRSGQTPWDLAYRGKKQEVLDYLEKRLGYSYEESYHNPIRRGFYPDPSIVRVGEDFYMVNSTFVFFPAIPVSHSRDLIHWEIIGYAITEPEYAGLDLLNGGMGYWAPDISYSEGTFYITATLRMNDDMEKRRVQMVTSSKKPEGPYDKPVFLDDDGIDPSIFHDDDGRKYMLLNRGARIRELSSDCRQFLSPASMLWYGDYKRKPEGPHLLKYNGFYYIFLAEGGTGRGHRITVARSETLMGPYEPSPYNPILHQWEEKALIQCCGHGKPVQLADGRWYMVYLCLRMPDGQYGILGRETSLDPMTWTEDGWPLINGGRGPSDQQKMPFDRTSYAGRRLMPDLCRKTGGYPRWMGQDWMTPRPLLKERIQTRRSEDGEEYLYLKGQEEDLNEKACRSILVIRQESFDFVAECELTVPDLKEGQSLGITCYYDENSFIKYGISQKGNRLGVVLQEYAGEEYVSREVMELSGKTGLGRELHTGDLILLGVKTEGLVRTFFCRYPEKAKGGQIQNCLRLEDTKYLSSEGLKKGKRFTGATVGIYVHGMLWGEFRKWKVMWGEIEARQV